MTIDIDTLKKEREILKQDFDLLSSRISQAEKDIGTMKSNLNAVFGSIQQVDKLMKIADPKKDEKQLLNEKEMPFSKQQALNFATS